MSHNAPLMLKHSASSSTADYADCSCKPMQYIVLQPMTIKRPALCFSFCLRALQRHFIPRA